MKGDSDVQVVENSRASYLSVAVAVVVFVTTFIAAVVFSVYILNRIDAVEREVCSLALHTILLCLALQ